MASLTQLLMGTNDRVTGLESEDIDLNDEGGITDIQKYFATLGLQVDVRVNIHTYNVCGAPLSTCGRNGFIL